MLHVMSVKVFVKKAAMLSFMSGLVLAEVAENDLG